MYSARKWPGLPSDVALLKEKTLLRLASLHADEWESVQATVDNRAASVIAEVPCANPADDDAAHTPTHSRNDQGRLAAGVQEHVTSLDLMLPSACKSC